MNEPKLARYMVMYKEHYTLYIMCRALQAVMNLLPEHVHGLDLL